MLKVCDCIILKKSPAKGNYANTVTLFKQMMNLDGQILLATIMLGIQPHFV